MKFIKECLWSAVETITLFFCFYLSLLAYGGFMLWSGAWTIEYMETWTGSAYNAPWDLWVLIAIVLILFGMFPHQWFKKKTGGR